MEELYSLVEASIDVAVFQKKFLFNMYGYLKGQSAKRKVATEFLDSSTRENLQQTITDLDTYIKGGDKTIKEGYCFLSKPEARKIRTYLIKIIEDAERYEYDRRPGRRKKSTKTLNK